MKLCFCPVQLLTKWQKQFFCNTFTLIEIRTNVHARNACGYAVIRAAKS